MELFLLMLAVWVLLLFVGTAAAVFFTRYSPHAMWICPIIGGLLYFVFAKNM